MKELAVEYVATVARSAGVRKGCALELP